MNRQLPVQLPEGYIDFYKNLETWQNEKQIKLNKQLVFEQFDLLPLLKSHGKPLLQLKRIKINTQEFEHLVIELLSFVRESRSDTAAAMTRLEDQLKTLDFDLIIEKLLNNQETNFTDLADRLDISAELLIFIFDHALRPFLRIIASPYQQQLNEDEFQSWELPTTCPICGGKSSFSRLRSQDGRRFMFCDRCFIEWEARYLECVHCGNNQPGTVKYFSIENDDAYQIYVCEKCKGYLKTYDERSAGKTIDLFVANMETIYLDLLAREKGYSNNSMN